MTFGGGCTDRSAGIPASPAAAALILVTPQNSPVARPLESTVATVGLEEVHVKATPGMGFPETSRAAALNCWVDPMMRSAERGVRVIALGGRVTVTCAVLLPTPLNEADTVALPD